jgi:hypothetical protein
VRIESGRAVAVYPNVTAGAFIASYDLAVSRPLGVGREDFTFPSGIRGTGKPDGLLVEVPAKKAFTATFPIVRRRDMCIRANFVALNPSVEFSLVLRSDTCGKASTQYTLAFRPGARTTRLTRLASSPDLSVSTALTAWQATDFAPVGQANDVEFRAFGTTLEGLVMGRRIVVVHDPTLGVGAPGIRIEASDGPARCLWRGLELREVG